MNIGSANGCDGFLKLKEREYLSVVLESGLSEPLKDLRKDAEVVCGSGERSPRVNICDCHWAYRNQGSAWEASRDDCGGDWRSLPQWLTYPAWLSRPNRWWPSQQCPSRRCSSWRVVDADGFQPIDWVSSLMKPLLGTVCSMPFGPSSDIRWWTTMRFLRLTHGV